MSNYVKHNRSKYKNEALRGDYNTIYFTLDREIVLDGQIYGCQPCVNITYDDLDMLLGHDDLVPGRFYRITDFITVTKESEDYRSAGHQFDIIVQATSTSTLSEDARACLHDGDSYFLNSNLQAWELKFKMESHPGIYEWLPDVGYPQGCIYYMKDEFGNECGYDFKNIQFSNMRNVRSSFTSFTEARRAELIQNVDLRANWFTDEDGITGNKTDWFYTFSDESNEDASLTSACYNNSIGNIVENGVVKLPKTVLQCTGGNIHSNVVTQCSQNIFVQISGNILRHNTFDMYCNNVCICGYELYDNRFYKCTTFSITGCAFGNDFFYVNKSILYCGINSGNHIKNNHFNGWCDGLKLHMVSMQNIHILGYCSDICVLLSGSSYFLSSVFYPYASNISISGFTKVQNQTFMGSNINMSGTGKVYSQVFYPGNYSNSSITAFNRDSNGADAGVVYEFKPTASITHIV